MHQSPHSTQIKLAAHRALIGLLLGLSLALAAGCRGEPPSASPKATSTVPHTASSSTPPPTLTPTAPPTPSLLIYDPEALLSPQGGADGVLRDYATTHGLEIRNLPELSAIDPGSDIALLILVRPTAQALDAALSRGNWQIVALDAPGEANPDISERLLLIGKREHTDLTMAFGATYAATVLAPEWRLGVVLGGEEAAEDLVQASVNGMRFYCGLCRQTYPPFLDYPLVFRVAEADDPEAWPAIWRAVSDQPLDILVIWADSPPPLVETGQIPWIYAGPRPLPEGEGAMAWVRPDYAAALEDALQGLERGTAPEAVNIPLSIQPLSEKISEGRLRFIRQTLERLGQGLVSPIP